MPTSDELHWTTDDSVFLELPGGAEIVERFEFVPSFHDATLEKLELTNEGACLVLRTFRMTTEVDAKGYFVLDRHSLVTLRFSEITGLEIDGESGLIVSDLGVRRLSTKPSSWAAGTGPEAGDIEVAWDSCSGFDGPIFARRVALEFRPLDS